MSELGSIADLVVFRVLKVGVYGWSSGCWIWGARVGVQGVGMTGDFVVSARVLGLA